MRKLLRRELLQTRSERMALVEERLEFTLSFVRRQSHEAMPPPTADR